ncbi:MAG: inverse autotransporter beta domain-containing protein [Chthoniobacteraceae bacterium]
MKTSPLREVLATLLVVSLFALSSSVNAGTEIESKENQKLVVPPEKEMPRGMVTLGVKASSDLTSGFLDSILPVWNPGDLFLFLDTRTTFDSDDQLLGSYGLGTRYLVPDHDVIIGFNAFYDSIHSRAGNDFDELGLGAEILTKWVDARFNYYLPETKRYEISRHSDHEFGSQVGPVFRNRIAPRIIALQQEKSTRDRRSTARRYEYAVEGWNAEVGLLIPGLDRYMEVRLFAGAYGYGDAVGFKGRVEARPLPGVIANIEYWEDSKLTGGHWTGELAVSVPFSLFNLASGRNPFEGFSDSFRPRQREFRERLSDMIIRSHRVMTDESSTTTSTTQSNTSTATEGVIRLKPPVRRTAAPPPPDDG